MDAWVLLAIAITAEVIGTLLAWGTCGQRMAAAATTGMGLIVAGVLVLDRFPSSSAH